MCAHDARLVPTHRPRCPHHALSLAVPTPLSIPLLPPKLPSMPEPTPDMWATRHTVYAGYKPTGWCCSACVSTHGRRLRAAPQRIQPRDLSAPCSALFTCNAFDVTLKFMIDCKISFFCRVCLSSAISCRAVCILRYLSASGIVLYGGLRTLVRARASVRRAVAA